MPRGRRRRKIERWVEPYLFFFSKANRLTTQPQRDTENVDEAVPAAHKHLRFGGSKGVVMKAKTASAMSRQPSSILQALEQKRSESIRPRTSVR